MTYRMMPPTIRLVATTVGVNSSALIFFSNSSPITAAGIQATTMFSQKRTDACSPRNSPPSLVSSSFQ